MAAESSNALKASGMTRATGSFKRNIPEDILLKIKAKLKMGESAGDIAKETGVSRQWIYDLKMRDAEEIDDTFKRIGEKAAAKLVELLEALEWNPLLEKSPESVPKIMSELVKLGHGAATALVMEGKEVMTDVELQGSISRLEAELNGTGAPQARAAGGFSGPDVEAESDGAEPGADPVISGGESIGENDVGGVGSDSICTRETSLAAEQAPCRCMVCQS